MQTNQVFLNEKNQASLVVENSIMTKFHPKDEKIHQKKDDVKKNNKSSTQPKEKPYHEPIIPRSGRKDRLEIW